MKKLLSYFIVAAALMMATSCENSDPKLNKFLADWKLNEMTINSEIIPVAYRSIVENLIANNLPNLVYTINNDGTIDAVQGGVDAGATVYIFNESKPEEIEIKMKDSYIKFNITNDNNDLISEELQFTHFADSETIQQVEAAFEMIGIDINELELQLIFKKQ